MILLNVPQPGLRVVVFNLDLSKQLAMGEIATMTPIDEEGTYMFILKGDRSGPISSFGKCVFVETKRVHI